MDGIPVTLAHFPSVGADDFGKVRQQGRGFHQHRCIEAVKAPSEFTGQFQVGELIVADRHGVGLIEQNVRGLQDGIAQKPVRREIASFNVLPFFFIGGIPFEPGNWGDHRQEYMQDGMSRHVGLDEHGGALRVNPDGEPINQ